MCSHLLSSKNLSIEFIEDLFRTANDMKDLVQFKGGDKSLSVKVMTSAFFEASTRTNCSFQAAMLRLGGKVIATNETFSSVIKGESLGDTIRTLACYSDVIVLRHPQVGASEIAASVSTKSIINAGDGIGEHPTQSLLDLYTIQTELHITRESHNTDSGFEGRVLTVTFLGDLKHGRTVHSLVLLLSRWFINLRLVCVAPEGLELPEEIKDAVRTLNTEHGLNVVLTECSALSDSVVAASDVLYVTRIQRERFESQEAYERVAGSYCVDAQLMTQAKSHMVLMHPLPRLGEISPEVDLDPRAAYFRQVQNGLYVRMAILKMLLAEK